MKCIECQQMVKPYLENRLPDKDLEQFLDHVENCPACYEELEIYYTIYEMLKSPEDETESDPDEYNFERKLKENMKSARRYLYMRKAYRLFRYVAIAFAEVLLVCTLVTGLEIRRDGDQKRTTLYRLLYGIPPEETERESESAAKETALSAAEAETETESKSKPKTRAADKAAEKATESKGNTLRRSTEKKPLTTPETSAKGAESRSPAAGTANVPVLIRSGSANFPELKEQPAGH